MPAFGAWEEAPALAGLRGPAPARDGAGPGAVCLGDEGVGGGPDVCGAMQCACVPHLGVSDPQGPSFGLTVVGTVSWCEVAGFRLGPLSEGGERES